MTVKTPIRTVFDLQNNATGLAEFQSGERVGISHGGTGLASVGTAGQVLAVNANTNGLEYVDSDTATINDRMQVANTNLLVNDRMQVANAVSKTSTTAQSMKATLAVDSEGASSGVVIANGAISIYTATGSPAYVDFYCESSNAHRTRVKSAAHSDYSGNIDLTLPVTAGTLGLDADIKDRMQVANTTTLVNDRMQVANTTTLVNDRMQVANTIALANARLGAAATVALTGDVTASATAFSSNAASISTTIASNSVDGSKLTDNITIAENLVVSGNLTVSGTQTTVNSNEVNIGDAILTLNSDLGSGVAASEDAGISINRGSDSDVSFIYDESEDRWSLGSQQLVSGDLIPNSDSAEDLGTNTVRWRKLFADDIDVGNDISVAGDVTVSGTINATITGTSDNATALATARAINLGGDLSGSANFDGSQDITISATIQNNSVALGTDTTGNYVGTLTAGQSLTTSGASTGEGIAHALSLDADARHPAATDVYHGNAHEYIHADDGNEALRFYCGNAEEMRLEADGDLHVEGDVVSESTTVSDEREKENIHVVEDALNKIHQLRGVEFTWKKDGRHSAGVIAQDVEKVLPQAVKEIKGITDEDYRLSVRYDSLHALTIEAIKTMSDEIAALKEEIKILKGE